MGKLQTLLLGGLLFLNGSVFASTLSVVQNMSFGTWVPTSASGSIVLSQSGTTTVTNLTAAPSGTAASQAILKYTGSGLVAGLLDVVTITPQASTLTLTGSGGGTVTVSNWTPAGNLTVSLLNPSVNIPMGGTLNFSGSPSGTYTGSVLVQGNGLTSPAATVLLPVSVRFWRTLTVAEQTQLNFGAIEMRTGAAVIKLDPQTGIRSFVSGSGNVNLVTSPTPTAGVFNITGEPNVSVTVTLPSSITLTGSTGGTMTVNTFTKSVASPTLNSSGQLSLGIGANLNINASQTAGTYTGTYTLTINY